VEVVSLVFSLGSWVSGGVTGFSSGFFNSSIGWRLSQRRERSEMENKAVCSELKLVASSISLDDGPASLSCEQKSPESTWPSPSSLAPREPTGPPAAAEQSVADPVITLIHNVKSLLSVVGKAFKRALVGWLLHDLDNEFLQQYFLDGSLRQSYVATATTPTARQTTLKQPIFTKNYQLNESRVRTQPIEVSALRSWCKQHLFTPISGPPYEGYRLTTTKKNAFERYLKEVSLFGCSVEVCMFGRECVRLRSSCATSWRRTRHCQ
jgi:hypothetical protein